MDLTECLACRTQILKEDIAKHDKICAKRKKKKPKRKSLAPSLRKLVWDTYIGQKTSALCFCCWSKKITPFTYCNTFQAGHIISHAHGGPNTIDNLIPICRDCNMNMSDEDWDDYLERHPYLPLRIYGANPPQKVIWATTVIQSLARKWLRKRKIWATTVIQSLVRMWLERKDPNTFWRLEWERRQIY